MMMPFRVRESVVLPVFNIGNEYWMIEKQQWETSSDDEVDVVEHCLVSYRADSEEDKAAKKPVAEEIAAALNLVHSKLFGLQVKRAGEIPENGLFFWQGKLYVVLADSDNSDDNDELNRINVREIASRWTNNPYDRWQRAGGDVEPFMADCPVHEWIG